MRVLYLRCTPALMCFAILAICPAMVSPVFADSGIQSNGSTQYVSFGAAPDLGVSTFTLELWFRRDGAGATTSTGTGGVTAVPLLTKGRGEADGNNRDMNYFLGLGTGNVLVADFEEGTGQTSPGLNHPVTGTTPVVNGLWYHAAVTFDGATWRLYLNGVQDAESVVGTNRLPQSLSIQHAGMATAMTSTGAAAGFFAGVVDEARIWNRARDQAAIADSMFLEVTGAPGLMGRWGLEEGTGTAAMNSVAGGSNGTLIGGPAWVPGSPFEFSNALKLGASNAYVTFGDPDALDLAEFTLETWFRRDGTGTAVSTGSGGITAIPLVTKGAAEADGSTVDMNFFLGIRGADNVLVGDFEEGSGGAGPQGLNHPVAGTTPIAMGTWYHAAATYDGATWRLYLNGNLEDTLYVGQPVQSASIQHAGLGTTLNSSGTPSGYFNGTLDEVRIWDHARSAQGIADAMNERLGSAVPGMVARWALDEWVGATVHGGAGTTVTGSLTGSGWTWAAGAPFDAVVTPPSPPADPLDLAGTAPIFSQATLTWTDAADNELQYEVERSLDGVGGTFLPLVSLPANSTSCLDGGLSAGTEYCYRVRAVNTTGASGYAGPICVTTPPDSEAALGFGGTNAFVAFGDPAALDLAQFTLEAWIRRDGAGVTASTGSGGVQAVPLITKGVGEADGDTRDMNYFLGIRGTDNVLAADFEEGTGGGTKGLNHPVVGHTPLAVGVWYHVAATYDGGTWKLYLDGNLEDSLLVGQPVESSSIQHAGLASALNSTGVASGFFHGRLDEVRIWNAARTISEIRATINAQLAAPASGLVARWALDEGWGSSVSGSAGTLVNGTVQGSGWGWTAGAPFDVVINDPPEAPVLILPADQAQGQPLVPTLEVVVSDPEADDLAVTFRGRAAAVGAPGPDFTLVMLPDTQYYTSELNGGTQQLLRDQANWVIAERSARNIPFVAHVGDCTENGDNAGNPVEWENADWALGVLEDPVLTGLPEGIPFGISVGNHDQSPNGSATGTTTFYNQYFGEARFNGRTYYGGHYGTNNDNHFCLFSAGGLDFLLVSMEYDTAPDAPVLAWAESLLVAHPARKAIVTSHSILGTGNPGTFSSQGQAIYDALKDRPNFLLMVCGHAPGEGRRSDVYDGRTVHTILADYQSLTNGGNGWLRLLEFSPSLNEIRVKTYSPTLDQWDTDATSQFTLPVDLTPSVEWETIGSIGGIPSGGTASIAWPGRQPFTEYEWAVSLSDGVNALEGPVWRFTTGPGADLEPPSVVLSAPAGGDTLTIGEPVMIQWSASDNVGVAAVDLYLSRSGPTGPFEVLAADLENDGTHAWTVVGPVTQAGWMRIVARDAAANASADTSDAPFWIRTGSTGIGDDRPGAYALLGARPNPIRGAHGTVAFALPEEARVRMSLVDVTGREVAILAEGTYPAGVHEISLVGSGAPPDLGAGIYILRFETPRIVLARKMTVIR